MDAQWLNQLLEVFFEFPFHLIGKTTMAFLTGQIMVCTKIMEHGWGPRLRISALFTDDLNQRFSFVSGTGYFVFTVNTFA